MIECNHYYSNATEYNYSDGLKVKKRPYGRPYTIVVHNLEIILTSTKMGGYFIWTKPVLFLPHLDFTVIPSEPAIITAVVISRNSPWSTTPSSEEIALAAARASLIGVYLQKITETSSRMVKNVYTRTIYQNKKKTFIFILS